MRGLGRVGADGRGRTALVAVLVVGALLTAGCARTVTGAAHFSSAASLRDAPDAKVAVNGATGSEVDRIAGNAISDIQAYWTAQLPKIAGKRYRPVSGGFYSVDPDRGGRVPCVRDPRIVKDNAFYCPSKDLVVYDRTGLLRQLDAHFGKYAIAMVLAHEWGHAIQTRTRPPGNRTIVVETQADCYAGAFTAYARAGHAPHFHIDSADLDRALSGYLLFADPTGTDQASQSAHGNAFDRISAFQQGFDNGPGYCASADNFSDQRLFTEVPFQADGNGQGSQDQAQNGNLPYADAITQINADLTRFWPRALSSWKPLAAVKNIDPLNDPPSCGGKQVTQSISYCADNNTIYFDGGHDLATLYQRFGDYSVGTLFATAYAFAARHDGGRGLRGRQALLGSVCYAGAYTFDVFAHAGSHLIKLSPGDLDEGIEALLLGVNATSFDGLAGTTGFQRVNAFQIGFRQGFGNAAGRGCRHWS